MEEHNRPLFKAIQKRQLRRAIKAELTEERFVRKTYHANNVIYDITHQTSPHIMQEIGRLREIAFRDAGGGTGQEVDIDEFDICPKPFRQLLVWSPRDREIISGYRYILGEDLLITDGKVHSPVGELFNFSQEFIDNYLPYSIELGRSFVQPKFQASRKGIFALDNIWDGLGAIIAQNPHIKYLYGKMTMYKNYNTLARDLILFFLQKHFAPQKSLIMPIHAVPFSHDEQILSSILTADNYADDYKNLVRQMTNLCCKIPPLVNIYMGLSSTMECYGTSDNPAFGEVEETAILVKIADINPAKKIRYVDSYINGLKDNELTD
ncbi:MAG: GNAT family N-acetyltransferase [Bacteroidales bacterium]|jgi:hypothetical protein|nr:GNAT family N-acetyltransferase [Bacteroidales bacterium]